MYLHLQSHEISSVIILASSLFIIMLNALTFISLVSSGIYLFGNKTLQLPLHCLN